MWFGLGFGNGRGERKGRVKKEKRVQVLDIT